MSPKLFQQLGQVLLASWALSGLGSELVGQAEKDALKQMKSAFRRGSPTALSIEAKSSALEAAAAFDSPALARALINAYRTLEKEAGPLETSRREAMMAGGGSRKLSPLREQVQPIHNMQRRLIEMIGDLQAPATVRELVTGFIRPRRRQPFALRLALSNRAGHLAERDLALVTEAGTKPKVEDRILLCKALGSLGKRAEGSVDWLLEQTAHESSEVRVAALKALESVASPKSLAPLISQLDAKPSRVRDQVVATLKELTGANPGLGAMSWRLWLADAGQVFVRGDKPLGGRGSKSRRAATKPAAGKPNKRKGRGKGKGKGKGKAQAMPKGTGSYFGIPQDGQSILYVFDNSASMKGKMGGGTKMDRCRAELHKGLNALTPNKTFNLMCFADKLRRFSDRMSKATPKNLARAHKWVDETKLELQTNSYDSLDHAFQLAGRGTFDRHYPVEADTIFYLTDGAPTRRRPQLRGGGRGKDKDRDEGDGKGKGRGKDKGQAKRGESIPEILDAVRRWNPLRSVVIHTIGLGVKGGRAGKAKKPGKPGKRAAAPKGARGFLQQLAAQNGGRFVTPQ